VAIRIESLTVENLRCFCGKHQLDFGQNDDASIDFVTGSNGAGKTTLADSIHLCLTGEFEDDSPLVTFDLADKLSPNEEVTATCPAVWTIPSCPSMIFSRES
jgi:DNA repair exonuclease SbcCD ATPase subunit